MKIYADVQHEIHVDPITVIEGLIDSVVGDGWITERDGKFYRGWEQSAGCHSIDQYDEITEEEYKYLEALETVMQKLKADKRADDMRKYEILKSNLNL